MNIDNIKLTSYDGTNVPAIVLGDDGTSNNYITEDSGTVTIQSTAVSIPGNLTLTGTFNGGYVTGGTNLTLTGNATAVNGYFSGTLDVTGATTLNSTLDVTGNATYAGTLDVTGLATVGDLSTDTITASGQVDISDAVNITGAVAITGQTNLHGEVEILEGNVDTLTIADVYDGALYNVFISGGTWTVSAV